MWKGKFPPLASEKDDDPLFEKLVAVVEELRLVTIFFDGSTKTYTMFVQKMDHVYIFHRFSAEWSWVVMIFWMQINKKKLRSPVCARKCLREVSTEKLWMLSPIISFKVEKELFTWSSFLFFLFWGISTKSKKGKEISKKPTNSGAASTKKKQQFRTTLE